MYQEEEGVEGDREGRGEEVEKGDGGAGRWIDR